MNAVKRKWKRIKVDIRVRIRCWDEPESAYAVVRTYELGVGGLSLYALKVLPVGTLVRIELGLPAAAGKFDLTAIVRNQRGFRLGMEFMDPPEAARLEIQRYVTAEAGAIKI